MDDVFRTIDINVLHSDFPPEGDSLSVSNKGLLHGQWDVAGSEDVAEMLLPKTETLHHDFGNE